MRKYQFTNKLMFAIVMHDPIARRGLIEKLFPDKKVKAIYFPGKNGEQEVADAKEVLKYGYRNPTGFRRWVKVAGSGGLCYTRVMGTWKSKTDTNICYSIILFSYASIERNC